MQNTKPRVLVLGSSGTTGSAVADRLDAAKDRVETVRASRNPATVEKWIGQGHAAVRVDLDDPDTFPEALRGVDRLFLLTGYTVAMTHQTKTVTDAAVDAGVQHIVHLGIFGDGRSTDPHFAWHELVERYIEGSGIPWTHLHPHMFMENLITTFPLRNGRLTWPLGEKPMGLIAGEDLTAVAAKVLAEGPGEHAGKGYWLSTDLFTAAQVTHALGQGLGRRITAEVMTPDELAHSTADGAHALPSFMEPNYAAAGMEYIARVHDGRLDSSLITTETVEELLGRPPIHLADWAALHRDELLASDDVRTAATEA
jgi:NAD(P)H dehydrogenase (quinone)